MYAHVVLGLTNRPGQCCIVDNNLSQARESASYSEWHSIFFVKRTNKQQLIRSITLQFIHRFILNFAKCKSMIRLALYTEVTMYCHGELNWHVTRNMKQVDWHWLVWQDICHIHLSSGETILVMPWLTC